MSAQISREGRQYVVTCAEHSWRWVATGGEAHATNLAAKHDREHEHAPDPGAGPTTLHLSRAADYLLTCHADMTDTDDNARRAYFAALDMWKALTGLRDQDALAYARQIRSDGFIAVIPPF